MEDLSRTAREMQDLGEWTMEALAINDAILETDPSDESAAVRRARCLRAIGRLEEALATLEALVERSPSNSVARSQAQRTRRRLKARRDAEQLFADDPDRLSEAVEAAKAGERAHDFQIEARRLFARRDRTTEAACALAAAQRHGRDLEGALNSYRWAWRQDGSPRTNAMAHVGLAGVLRDLRRHAEAEKILRGVLAVHPRDNHARSTLVAVLLDRFEHGRDPELLVEAKRLLDGVWASGDRGPLVRAAYRRLESLGGGG